MPRPKKPKPADPVTQPPVEQAQVTRTPDPYFTHVYEGVPVAPRSM